MSDWTDEQQEAINRWNEKDRSERHPHDLLPDTGQGYDRGVTEEQCIAMRDLFKQDDRTVKSMVDTEFDYKQTTIAEHIFGRCNHSVNATPADSPMGNMDADKFVTVEECRNMREYYYNEGHEEITEVEAHFDKTYGQVYHHLVARCKCEHGQPGIRD